MAVRKSREIITFQNYDTYFNSAGPAGAKIWGYGKWVSAHIFGTFWEDCTADKSKWTSYVKTKIGEVVLRGSPGNSLLNADAHYIASSIRKRTRKRRPSTDAATQYQADKAKALKVTRSDCVNNKTHGYLLVAAALNQAAADMGLQSGDWNCSNHAINSICSRQYPDWGQSRISISPFVCNSVFFSTDSDLTV